MRHRMTSSKHLGLAVAIGGLLLGLSTPVQASTAVEAVSPPVVAAPAAPATEAPAPSAAEQPWATVSVGSTGDHTCGVRVDGTLWCWGSAGAGDRARLAPHRVGSATTWATVSAGSSYTCATQTDGSAWCWGYNNHGQLGIGTTSDRSAPTRVDGGGAWAQLSAGDEHTCGVRTDGTLWCWGNGKRGPLGVGPGNRDRKRPVQVGTDTDWAGVTAAGWPYGRFSCGVRTDGTLWCWGDNENGQLGLGADGAPVRVPVQVGTGTDWVAVDGGNRHSCALRTDGSAWCWGMDFRGSLGTGGEGGEVPTRVVGDQVWSAISAGEDHTCASSSEDELWCWGWNEEGELGDGTEDDRDVPTLVAGGHSFVLPAAGEKHSCSVTTTGETFCWGDTDGRALGDGTLDGSLVPVRVIARDRVWTSPWSATDGSVFGSCGVTADDGEIGCWGFLTRVAGGGYAHPAGDRGGFDSAAMGRDHVCGIVAADDRLLCTGGSEWGALGSGSGGYTEEFHEVTGGGSWTGLTAGDDHTCGVQSDQTLWCWGYNSDGQLGLGDRVARSTPFQVGAQAWTSVAAGDAHTCGIDADAALWCWGDNAHGQLGDGTTIDRSAPVLVSGASWADVSLGIDHTCAVRTTGSLWCWGDNSDGELGDGTTTQRLTPTRVGTGTGWASPAVGEGDFSCARGTDGSAWCWGANDDGQLGSGSYEPSLVPVEVVGVDEWSSVSAHGRGGCGTTPDGTALCWGQSFADGTGRAYTEPVEVRSTRDL